MRIEPLGVDTAGTCGYRQGIVVAQSSSTFVGYNRIRDFRLTGILIKGASTTATVHSTTRDPT